MKEQFTSSVNAKNLGSTMLIPILDTDFFSGNESQGQAIKIGNIWTNILSATTGEAVNYEVVTTYKDGSIMTEPKVDGVIYHKRENEFLKIVFDTYINVKWFGAKGDGKTDDTQAINAALKSGEAVHMPPGVYLVTDTIYVGRWRGSLIGGTPNTRGDNYITTKILYNGSTDNYKSVVQLGANAVGNADKDASNLYVSNIHIDANYKAGFCMYGTYLTNETQIINIIATGSTQYNFYFAKSWYATFRNLTSLKCNGIGMSFGVPLLLMNGEMLDLEDTLEMNNTLIENIRSHRAGAYYSDDKPNTYKPELDYNLGYGIGLGVGYSFNVNTFTSEQSGGANVYIYTSHEDIKTIRNGYLEGSCVNSGLDPATQKANLIIDHINDYSEGGTYTISDVFLSYVSGGIFFKGTKNARSIKLENVRLPRFLKSLSGLSNYDLHRIVQKKNCYHEIGYYNTDEIFGTTTAYKTVNTRYDFSIDVMPNTGAYSSVLVKAKNPTIHPIGSIVYTLYNGQTNSVAFPNLEDGKWHHAITLYDLAKISKGGATNDYDSLVEIKVVYQPITTR